MNKILVANRGEIALRIMKTIRRMGIHSVAVYSEVDREAPHVLFADQAISIGKAPSNESYLNGQLIIQKALQLGVDAIHPGYGFLSENASFADAVQEAGLIFIGPSSHSIEIMGSKLAAKKAVTEFNIPLVPGTDHAIANKESALQIARKIGFPLLIKASAGGGGKGMRIVNTETELPEQMDRAISEARSAFGDGAVFIEKYVTSPRHIEIQILADQFGNTRHLFERECSIQRRHQKVVEEAPSIILTPELRAQMGADAIKVAKACNYVGAGTVEFLLDDQLNYYFLEMNTRLQVEHPVTEFITGLDLVEEQIKIAQGIPLSFQQDDLTIHGHSIELRVYAEDPQNDFLPSIGQLTKYKIPIGEGIRLDGGYVEGQSIPIYYDPMIAKLVVHAPSRKEAIVKMQEAITQYEIEGVKTTLGFGLFVLKHPDFVNGHFDTHFVKNNFNPVVNQIDEIEAKVAAKIALECLLKEQAILKVPKV